MPLAVLGKRAGTTVERLQVVLCVAVHENTDRHHLLKEEAAIAQVVNRVDALAGHDGSLKIEDDESEDSGMSGAEAPTHPTSLLEEHPTGYSRR